MTAPGRPYAEVIGDPVEHSLSPAIHGFWLEALGIAADYRRRRVTRVEFPAYLVKKRGDPLWRGSNITMPLKLDAAMLADDDSDRVIGIGAANLLVPRAGKIVAGNTDVGAVALLVERLAKAGARMDSIVLLGSGGAARAALMGLHLLGLTDVRIQSRNLGEAYKLAVQFKLGEEPRDFDLPLECAGLINATPLGMTGQPPFTLSIDAMPATGWVYDFVTSPDPTALITRAAARGMKTVGGVDMLIEQAAESFKLLFEKDAPRDKDAELRHRLKP
ncbi:shikimate dehydrogenase [Sphingomonas sp.]|uniref:shikimate dehydrogenase family protein n=1 Tax=Sphingomonas sp. TaxID=28214 RepID=UPI00286E5C10|nr:shikimate dehydrogenase [Sphingomonas sp.]